MSTTKDRVKEILNECCAGNASLATQILHTEFVIIARADLPEVETIGGGNVEVEGVEHSVWPINKATASRARRDALDYLAAAEGIESRLPTRRDELAAELSPLRNVNYGELSPAAQNAIDRIIELEEKAS